ncbi:MAG: PAS domain-containing protein [Bacteroidales bacterium]|nr:PAS domain-containing protein [Bacteroidales bacterium]
MKTKKPKSKISLQKKTSSATANPFPIVGIGASAGGLEALELFLGNVPKNSGLAYIVIQHLDPTQKGMLPELLQRFSAMKVFLVKDRMVVKPNCVYVIPPNKSMSILKGVLHLFDPIEARGLRLPIDFFLRSLADDLRDLGIGIILSGMGSDGSLGLRALKEKGGIVMAQDPASAKFDSMPRNAIDSVLMDIVAPANDLPVKLIEFIKNNAPIAASSLEIEIKDKSALEKIIILLRTYTGNDFSLYKKSTVYRRIERRMGVHKIDKITSYVNFLQKNQKEVDILFKELMIGVTNFFRDPTVWEKLKDTVIPTIIRNTEAGSIMRAWVPACSTGEEAYSLAITFKEVIGKINPPRGISLQIFATDLDNEAIETARKGVFPSNIAADVSTERLDRFFVSTENGYQVSSEIREMVVFAQHNIILHPPFTKIDIISCRNLLIYMDAELQKKLLGLFYYSTNPDGIVVLGSSETLGTQSHLFNAVDNKLKIFKRSITTLMPELFDFPTSFSRDKPTNIEKQMPAKSTPNIQSLADQLLLQHFSPSGVLVNENGDILYVSGRTGKYLEPAVGKANMNIFAMLRDGLRNEFPIAFRKAILKKDTVVLSNIKVGTNGGTQSLNVNIQWIDKPEQLYGTVMIIFTDVPEIINIKPATKKDIKASSGDRQLELEKELQDLREEMQNTVEEMQTSQEELKSTNEELQSTNEELQSTNEELTSSKEEMQSLNEELQTVNAELQSKVDDFSRVNNDMKNLLNATDIATLFLDKELNIRRYTNMATKIFKLIKSDIGRPLTDLVSELIYPELAQDALEVLDTLVFTQKAIPAKDGRWFSIRIMPYRTFDDRINGLVITFINISDLKQVEVKLYESELINRMLFSFSPAVFIKLSTNWKILAFNSEAEKFFGNKLEDAVDQNFIQMFIPVQVQKKTEKDLNKMLHEIPDNKIKIKVIAAGGNVLVVEWFVNIVLNSLKIPEEIIMITKNIS